MTNAEGPRKDVQPENRFFRLCRGFWQGPTRLVAWALSLGVLAFMGLTLGAQLAINSWHRQFFDALELRNWPGIVSTMWLLPAFVALYAVSQTVFAVLKMVLQMRWRQWLTSQIIGHWVSEQRYYRLQFASLDSSAPEYRIAEDVRLTVDPLVDFILGFLGALFSGIAFAAILLNVAGSIQFDIAGMTVIIPGYMAMAAIIYALLVSSLMLIVGRPLIARIAFKNEREARFRAEMTRLRDNAESVAFLKGDTDERRSIHSRFREVISAWASIIRQQGVVGVVLNTNGALFPILPVLLIAPKYLSGDLSLGAVMQVVAAFTAVQAALIWFVDNFIRIAEWYASVVRVDELLAALTELDDSQHPPPGEGIERLEHAGNTIILENLAVAHRSGVTLIAQSSVTIAHGEKVFLTGASGSGKSTLIRALAGIWPWGAGRILLPAGAKIIFVPQKPYVPIGTLRHALTYAMKGEIPSDGELFAMLVLCGLGDIAPRLDMQENWDQILSGGERQRLAFARLFLQKPDIVVLDEATSALDGDGQVDMLRLLRERLADVTLISVGHRLELGDHHERRIALVSRPEGAVLSSLPAKRARRAIQDTARLAKILR
jgi:vitamin B12/bleomycin/antimicrobial peptide transport system ATP-binding/permease protein